MPEHSRRRTLAPELRRLADQVLEAPDLQSLARLLGRALPEALGLSGATLLLWDRRLDSFETLPPNETQIQPLRPEHLAAEPPEARFLISDGTLIETGASGEAVVVPLLARSGLVGTLVMQTSRRRRRYPFTPAEARLVWRLAGRAAIAIENQLYLRELVASERMVALGTMAGMLAHDFRGPMTVIRGYAEILQEGQGLPADAREQAALIVQMVDRLERMTSETLDFARGGGRLLRRAQPLGELLHELCAGIEREFPGLEVVADLDVPPLETAELDVDRLRRALGNLAANAREAMGGRGRLRFAAGLAAGAGDGPPLLTLTVADEGPGVPEAIRARLFDPFVTQGKRGGTGLGLAVARKFIEDHGGTVELLPGGPGARFRIALPLR